ncbi:MAG: ribosomal protein S18-alanine N-acetyltransferase [Clostridiales bacterium]|jgi:ribosomal-protein-alanine N-acetyltransferase|nr:ribosomal protein S18-alanine N-acetyltransferase [Clostridiales bacterium]
MSGAFFITPANAEHIPEICLIERQSFSTPWSAASFQKEFSDGLAHYFVALSEGGGDVVGYCGYWSIVGEAHITNVAVRPDFRRRGVARALLSAMLADIAARGHTAATLEVRDGNSAAICLYEGFGFYHAGVRKNYYQKEKKDALIMWKRL